MVTARCPRRLCWSAMSVPRDDDLADDAAASQAGRAEFCPRCGVKRVGAFRSCLSCHYDYEAPKKPLFVPPPEARSDLAQARPPAPVMPPAPPARLQAAEVVLPTRATVASAPATTAPAEPSAAQAASVAPATQTARTGARTTGRRRTRLAAGVGAVLLVVAVAIVASGVGQKRATTLESSVPPPSHDPIASAIPLQAVSEKCVKQLGPFVTSLGVLDAAIGPDVTFHDYSQTFAASQAARGQVNLSDLDPPCIAVFAAAQRVLGDYIKAYNIWNDCTTTTGCTRSSIESSLEARWASAKSMLARVTASIP